METAFGHLGYSLGRYFLRNGLATRQPRTIKAMVRLAERASGIPCSTVPTDYLRDFADSHGIRPYAPKLRSNIRRRKGTKQAAFYLSDEWRALRYRVIRESDGRCQACGATAKTSGRPMHVDHIIPRSIAPYKALDYSNLQLLCEACNLGKSNTDSINWKLNGIAA